MALVDEYSPGYFLTKLLFGTSQLTSIIKIKKVRELDRTETSGLKGCFEKKKRKKFKHHPTISKM